MNCYNQAGKDLFKHEDSLLNYGKFVNKKINMSQREAAEDLLKSSFKPSICEYSKKLERTKSSKGVQNRCNFLYEDGIKRKTQIKTPEEKKYSFTPTINVYKINFPKKTQKRSSIAYVDI